MISALTLVISLQAPSPEAFQTAGQYFERTSGHAMVVMQGGKVVFEKYADGWNYARAHYLASGSKSFSGIIALAAQEDGLLKLDETASKTLSEWRSDPRLAQITIRQLLTLSSGIDVGENLRGYSWADGVDTSAKFAPGTRFEYGPKPFQAFAEIMRRKGKAPISYLKNRVLEPIGMKIGFWAGRTDPNMAGGASATAREWAKLGQLILQKGAWNGKQILRASSIAELTKGTRANPGYGLTFWLNKPKTVTPGAPSYDAFGRSGKFWPNGPENVFMAAGMGKQRLYIIPSRQMVVIRVGEQSRFSDGRFLDLLTDR